MLFSSFDFEINIMSMSLDLTNGIFFIRIIVLIKVCIIMLFVLLTVARNIKYSFKSKI